ncbi:N5-glutamine methyltransferase family protein [Holospora undulata]|uniref:Release factor glutamine methyltransferase n=1 Tax=Holospora undulata HU1 TaxID=1321371 RepID=A0A061JFQ9_9PROT|nr:HemK/PrmC family methyltransferase [Holospora undulata]ETZ04455.1 release factor glutamine methyltransferase [Holospora undulata HU1]
MSNSFHEKAIQLAKQFVCHKGVPFEVGYRWGKNFLQEAFDLSPSQWAYKMFDVCPLHAELDKWVQEFITKHKPLSRSTQRRFFWNQWFALNEFTLDPRPETEGIVSLILNRKTEVNTVLDLGTGSGCILLSFLEAFPKAKGLGVDIQSDALKVAHQNAFQLGIGHRVQWICSNWYTNLETNAIKKNSFDLIVSNPPYIPSSQWIKLPPEVRFWDPKVALDGGKYGITPYKTIIPGAKQWLTYGGVLALEISSNAWLPFLISLGKQYFSKVSVFLDDFGRNRYLILY